MSVRSDSSSGEEDGDAEWRKNISSVAAATSSYINGAAADDDAVERRRDQKPKHCQLKMQKLLDDMLEKSLVMVNNGDGDGDDTDVVDSDMVVNDGDGFRLFKNSTPGQTLLHRVDEPRQPRKRPKIIPGEEINEKLKKFKRRMRSVVVEGGDVISTPEKAVRNSLARLEAEEAAKKMKAKAEEERVTELKRIRDERWLPSRWRKIQIMKLYNCLFLKEAI